MACPVKPFHCTMVYVSKWKDVGIEEDHKRLTFHGPCLFQGEVKVLRNRRPCKKRLMKFKKQERYARVMVFSARLFLLRVVFASEVLVVPWETSRTTPQPNFHLIEDPFHQAYLQLTLRSNVTKIARAASRRRHTVTSRYRSATLGTQGRHPRIVGCMYEAI